ncbi:MAG: dTDP-4-dehydrorhamnose reductase [Planctomycetota bacterium]|jgi:dTDP-4-dehydrorhamnose reductase
MSSKTLLIGGSGRLGRELSRVLDCDAPPSTELDIRRRNSVEDFLSSGRYSVVIHAAAVVGVRPCEDDPVRAHAVNAEGTRSVALAAAASRTRLVYISTDAVFDGKRGGYREDDPPNPLNAYALTKLLGESFVRMTPRHLVVRTSFVPAEGYTYPRAFVDQWTSRLPAPVVAEEIAFAMELGVEGVLHIGGARRRQIDVARDVSPDVGEATRAESGLELPEDMSLDSSRWRELRSTQARAPLPS